jgi:hypothetical protein
MSVKQNLFEEQVEEKRKSLLKDLEKEVEKAKIKNINSPEFAALVLSHVYGTIAAQQELINAIIKKLKKLKK